MSVVLLVNLSCSFPGGVKAVQDLSLELTSGEFFCLLGPSGCGKSTLLRLIGGYIEPDAGDVFIGARKVTREPPENRHTGMVFQNYALFPHLSAFENVAFGLRIKGTGEKALAAKVHEMLDWVGFSADERQRFPAQLSGGQQQRVALARAIAFEPQLLMLDEPFANLDRLLRERLREETKEVQRRAGVTTILVTHDREEALTLGDRIGIMHEGTLLQVGEPQDVYRRPCTLKVAEFLGHKNLFPITAIENGNIRSHSLVAPIPDQMNREDDFLILWPDRIHLDSSGDGVPVSVERWRFLGAHNIVTVKAAEGQCVEVLLTADSLRWPIGHLLGLRIPQGASSTTASKHKVG